VNPQRISFARTLPILAFLISYVIIAVPATMAYINLKSASRNGSDVIVRYHQVQVRIPHEHFLRRSVQAGADITSHYIQALNMPGFIVQIPADRCTKAWPSEWVPAGWDFTQWRALILPLCCVPFWLFAGVGVDSLTMRRRLAWWILLSGTILWASMAVFEVGLWLAAGAERKELVFPFWGLGLWFVLLTAFPITWVKQWLTHRRIRTSLHARLSAELQ
jgi:hypothetical protein